LVNPLALQLAFDCSAARLALGIGALSNKKESQMKALTTMFAITLAPMLRSRDETVF